MRRAAAAAALLAVAACRRPGGAVDAGAPVALDAGALTRRSTDLRTVVLQAFPEYRGTRLLSAQATVTRRVTGATPAAREAWLAQGGFSPEDGGPGWVREGFRVAQPAPDTFTVTLPFDERTLFQVFQAPTSLSSMELALWLPRALPVAREDFEVALHYEAPPERAAFLVKQAVELLLGNAQWTLGPVPGGWEARPADGGFGGVPGRFSVEVTSAQGARITFARDGGDVHVTYRLVTAERQ